MTNAGIGVLTTDLFKYAVVADKIISFSILPKVTWVNVTSVRDFSSCTSDALFCPHPLRPKSSDNDTIEYFMIMMI